MERNNFYNSLMSDPNTDMFYRLIKRNRPNGSKNTACISYNGNNLFSLEDQTKTFAHYYEDLAMPKDKIITRYI